MAGDDSLSPKTRLFAAMAPAIGTSPAAHLCNLLEEWIEEAVKRNRINTTRFLETALEFHLDGALVTIVPKGSPGNPPRQLPDSACGEEEIDPL